MANAWSFLYDEIMNDSPPASSSSCDRITDATEKDYKDFWESNGVTVSESGNLFLNSDHHSGVLGEDYISLNEFKLDLNTEESNMTNSVHIPDLPDAPNNNNGRWKYHEDVILKEIKEYLGGTYKSHYASPGSKTQTLDLIEGIGDAEPFCRSNAIKYLSRFGKKEGKSKQDILKAIHYCILLYHFAGLCNENSQPYETF